MPPSAKKPATKSTGKNCRPRPAGSSALPKFRGPTRSPPEAVPALPDRASGAAGSGPRPTSGATAGLWLVSQVATQQTFTLGSHATVLAPPADLIAGGAITEQSEANGKVKISFTGEGGRAKTKTLKLVQLGKIARSGVRVIFQPQADSGWHLGYVIGAAAGAGAGGSAPGSAPAACPPGCVPAGGGPAQGGTQASPAAQAPGRVRPQPAQVRGMDRRPTMVAPGPSGGGAAAPGPSGMPAPQRMPQTQGPSSQVSVRDFVDGQTNAVPTNSLAVAVPDDMDVREPALRLGSLVSKTVALVRYRRTNGSSNTATLPLAPMSSLVGRRALVALAPFVPQQDQKLLAMQVGVSSAAPPPASAPLGSLVFETVRDGASRYIPREAIVVNAPADLDVSRSIVRIVGGSSSATIRYHRPGVPEPVIIVSPAGPAAEVLDALVLVDLGDKDPTTNMPLMYAARRPEADVQRAVRDRRADYQRNVVPPIQGTLTGGERAPGMVLTGGGDTIAPGGMRRPPMTTMTGMQAPRVGTIAAPPPMQGSLFGGGPRPPGDRDTVATSPNTALNLVEGGTMEFAPNALVVRKIPDMRPGVAYLSDETERTGKLTYPSTSGKRTVVVSFVSFASVAAGEEFLGASPERSDGRVVFVPMRRLGDSDLSADTGRIQRDTVIDAPRGPGARDTVLDPRDTLMGVQFDASRGAGARDTMLDPRGPGARDTMLDPRGPGARDTMLDPRGPGARDTTLDAPRAPLLGRMGTRTMPPATPDPSRRVPTIAPGTEGVAFYDVCTMRGHFLRPDRIMAPAPDDIDERRPAAIVANVPHVEVTVRYTTTRGQEREATIKLVPVPMLGNRVLLISGELDAQNRALLHVGRSDPTPPT